MERLPGFRDFYPEPIPPKGAWSADVRDHILQTWKLTARRYGFREYDGPPLEQQELYTKKSGEEIVDQLFNFIDKGNREVAMRPEMTPTLVRMVAANERHYKKPIKWFSIPQLFRYEKQQKGRLREHFQFNADILGEDNPNSDAELVALLIDSLRAFGLTEKDFTIRLSSRTAWQEYYQKQNGELSRAYEFYQIIDKLERTKPDETNARLKKLDLSLDEIQRFIENGEPTEELQTILDNLNARGLGDYVRIDYRIIRGLAYYTGPVFEAFDIKGELRAIAGGGRYDNLVELISGGKVNMPALGFGMGDVVLYELLKDRDLLNQMSIPIDIYCLIDDERLRPASLKIIQQLRDEGKRVEYALASMKSDKQFKKALELNAKFTLTLEKEFHSNQTVRLKNLQTREQNSIPSQDIIKHLE